MTVRAGRPGNWLIPHGQEGSIIEENLEIEYERPMENPLLYHDVPLQFRVPCEKLTYSYAYPDWWRVRIKNTDHRKKPKLSYKSDAESKKQILTYTAENVPAVVDEPFSPYFKQMANYLELMVINLSHGPDCL